jgi:hypothetical protein
MVSLESLSFVLLFSLTCPTLKSDVSGGDMLKTFFPDLHSITLTPVLWLNVVKSNKRKIFVVLCNCNGSDGLSIKFTNPKSILIKGLIAFKIVFSSIELLTVAPYSDHIVFVRFETSDNESHARKKKSTLIM